MQLHPAEPAEAVAYCVKSLAAGYIGLDFGESVGDLLTVQRSALPSNQQDYWAFANEMKKNDRVLIIAHHFPFALTTVSGPYNYIRERVPELGIWFRHFRSVRETRYFADYSTDVRAWDQLTMIDTISPLRDRESKSYRLIAEWSGDA
jgi:hypothetical protein